MSLLYSTRPTSTGFYRIRSTEQARLLDDPEANKYFWPFLGQEMTVTEAARDLGCKLNAMHYRVKTFQAAGLLKVAREVKRGGRPIKAYRSVSDAFFLPFDLTRHASAEEDYISALEPMLRKIAAQFARQRRESGSGGHVGNCIFREEDNVRVFGAVEEGEGGEITLNADDPSLPVGADRCGSIQLTQQEAEALERELIRLFGKYLKLAEKDRVTHREEHLFIYAFAPLHRR